MIETRCIGFLLFNRCNRTAKLIPTDYAAITRDIRASEDYVPESGCAVLFQLSETEHADLSSMCSITQTGVPTVPEKNILFSNGEKVRTQVEPEVGTSVRPSLHARDVRRWAQDAGFNEAGIVSLPHAQEDRDATRYADWIDAGRGGTMRYLERRDEHGRLVRERVAIPFPWARSAIVCFAGYHSQADLSTKTHDARSAWIARYAWSSRGDAQGIRRPSDYHKILLKRLRTLEARLRQECVSSPALASSRADSSTDSHSTDQPAEIETRCYVDTGPVVERALATAAGLGWTGKNTCLIHPQLGSFGFLAVLLTSVPLAEDSALAIPHPDRCGTCTRCIEACPTNALDSPYQMNASRCISYLTIEHKGPIAEELMAGVGRQVFGCDICQDVCPWNRKAPIAADPQLEPRPELVNPLLDWLADMDQAEFEAQFNGSPVRRAGFDGLRRNIAVAMGNSGLERYVPALEKWSDAAEEGLRTAAQWALRKLHRNP
jgi:epoxyqueuosine reductase